MPRGCAALSQSPRAGATTAGGCSQCKRRHAITTSCSHLLVQAFFPLSVGPQAWPRRPCRTLPQQPGKMTTKSCPGLVRRPSGSFVVFRQGRREPDVFLTKPLATASSQALDLVGLLPARFSLTPPSSPTQHHITSPGTLLAVLADSFFILILNCASPTSGSPHQTPSPSLALSALLTALSTPSTLPSTSATNPP